MNWAYIIFDGRLNEVAQRMIATLLKHNDCRVLVNWVVPNLERFAEMKARYGDRLVLKDVPRKEWNNHRMYRKVERLNRMPFEAGDRVFVLDTDLWIQGEIFGALEGADVFVTTRHYDYWYPVNGGVWGFEFNERSRAFLEFFVAQMEAPSWQPFMDFQSKWHHVGHLDWWCDQDFLCTAHAHQPPVDVSIGDLGPKYNFCPSVEEAQPGTYKTARTQILEKLGSPEYRILHFKGRLKDVMLNEVEDPR
jgi:hypothetical protein